jgi:hypothetical protein
MCAQVRGPELPVAGDWVGEASTMVRTLFEAIPKDMSAVKLRATDTYFIAAGTIDICCGFNNLMNLDIALQST